MENVWWKRRGEDLARLARESGPVLVFDGETLNDIVFDLGAVEGVDAVLFDLSFSAQSDLLGAVARLGAGFVWGAGADLARMPRHVLRGLEKGVYRPSPTESRAGLEEVPGGCLTAIPAGGPTPGRPHDLEGRDVLLDLSEPVSLRSGSPGFNRLGDLERRGARVRGVFLSWNEPGDLENAGDVLEEWKTVPVEDGIAVAGRGLTLAFDRESGRLDPLATGGNVLALKKALPEWSFWLEPGSRFFSAAGALVVPVEGKPPKVMPWPGPSHRGPMPESRGWTPARERFLNARRICPAPL